MHALSQHLRSLVNTASVTFIATSMGLSSSAIAQSSSVSLYGIVDAGIDFSAGPTGTVTRVSSGIQSASRWGIRGSEDLGGGLKAGFNLESGFSVANGAAQAAGLFARRATVALSGGFGEVQIGRQFTPEALAVFAMDPFDAGSPAGPANTWSTLNFRTNNGIVYTSPNLGGVTARLMYAPGGDMPVKGANNDVGGSIGYANGPINIAAAFDNRTNDLNTGKRKFLSVGGNYNFGVAKAFFALRSQKGTTQAGTAPVDARSFWVGGEIPFGGVHTVRFAVGKVNDGLATNRDATGLGLGYFYDMSKRTNFYSIIGRINNKLAVGGYTVDNGLFNAGGDSQAITFGIRHKF